MRETILLLASEAVISKTIRNVLEAAGYFVIAGDNLGKIRDRLLDCAPDLLVIRHFVDGIPGHEAALYLRSLAPGIPILLAGGPSR
jgi:DNA-binding response OmpR family regulator